MGRPRTPDRFYYADLPFEAQVSSPYEHLLVASSSNLHVDGYFPSPAYSDPLPDNMVEDREEVTEERRSHQEFDSVPLNDEEVKPKPTVHYPEVLSTAKPALGTFDSDIQSSRPSSIGGTDEEDSEDYDWSGEDDLVDEEARFVKQMGVKTEETGWSFKR